MCAELPQPTAEFPLSPLYPRPVTLFGRAALVTEGGLGGSQGQSSMLLCCLHLPFEYQGGIIYRNLVLGAEI